METIQQIQPSRKIPSLRKKTMKRNLSLSKLYDGLSGYNVNTNNIKEFSTTYGELKESSIPVLYEIFNKYAPLSKIAHPFRNFYDLGSGIGKVVVGMAHANSTITSTGIEIVPDRIKMANDALDKIRDVSLKKRIEMICISMLDNTVHYNDACWIYLSNLTMDDNIVERIFEKFAKEVKQGCIIITSKITSNSSFQELNHITLPMSWSDDSKVYIYKKIENTNTTN